MEILETKDKEFRIAALTMLRSDDFFLGRWVRYYASELGEENLYIWFDGMDQTIPSFCGACHTAKVKHTEAGRLEGDRIRAAFLSKQAANLLEQGYDAVIGTDVDEFLAVDPLLGKTLSQMIGESSKGHVCISGLGIDVGQNLREEGRLDPDAPFLSQRSYARLSTRYTKASVITAPVEWGSGFHRVRKRDFHIVKGLYLFHFGCVDLERIKAKMGEGHKLEKGWSAHLKKRTATIRLASSVKAGDWERCTAKSRKVQTLVRSPFAWNKPAMFGARILVKIPERFSKLF